MASERSLWLQYSKENFAKHSRRSFPFFPGLFFLTLGLVVVCAPKLIIAAIAGLFFFVGAVFCVLAWKFMQFKGQILRMAKEMEGKVQVQPFQVRTPPTESAEADSKKIIYH